MEQLPVPKNVLEVEFKLFGALTVKQFLKVLLGCLLALGLFLTAVHPIVKFPVMAILVGVGVGSALIPGFEVKLIALARAVFVSPRYVWRKESRVPDILKEVPKAQTNDKKTPTSADDVDIDTILAARRIQNTGVGAAQSTELDQNDSLGAIYQEVYGANETNEELRRAEAQRQEILAQVQASQAAAPTSEPPAVAQSAVIPAPAALSPANTNQVSLAANYQEELAMLKSQLQTLTKSGADPRKQEQVIARINEIYQALQTANGSLLPSANAQALKAQEQLNSNSRLIYGVVVSKRDEPLQGVDINILNVRGEALIHGILSKADGSFAIDAPLSEGEYIVRLRHAQYKFADFKIVIDKQKLPGFKFRAN